MQNYTTSNDIASISDKCMCIDFEMFLVLYFFNVRFNLKIYRFYWLFLVQTILVKICGVWLCI